MKAPPRLTLPAALTAAVLAITTLTPVAALEEAATTRSTTLSEEREGNLVSQLVESEGEVVSTLVDGTTGEAVLPDPEQAGTQPAAGDPLGGAVLGQWAKSDRHFEQLAANSARTAAELAGESDDDADDAAADDVDPAAEAGAGVASASALGAAASWAPSGIKGTDVSNWQPSLNWSSLWNQGSRFAYVKSSEGDSIRNSLFTQQYAGAGAVGMYRGGYHFAIPTRDSSGAKQADYFLANGGGWSADGRTLPGLLDIENNPYPSLYGNACYGFSPSEMVRWIRDFSDRYKSRTGRLPAIYTNYYWWRDCTGNSSAFNDHPMHIAAYETAAPTVPSAWSTYDFWQYTDAGFAEQIDANVYRGSATQLRDLARNASYKPLGGRAPASAPATPTEVAPAGYVVKGAIGNQYRALGGSSVFGTPTGNERGGLLNGGVLQGFSKKQTFYWTSSTGAWPVNFNGAIGRKFAANRWENGYGYPTTREAGGLVNGGAYQVFRKGRDVTKVLWSPATGAVPVRETSGIGGAWKRAGHERGYGYPVTSERGGLLYGGAYQVFRNGSRVYRILWSSSSGAHAVQENGAIGREWIAAGSERGYGYPTTNEYRYGSEIRQRFSKNFTVHYSTTTKRTWVTR
ncbi:GH25 family lysozyme [Kocuria sp. CPCC 205268]|uniref:GH25 family lysozyme n=1 Tax=Kocuria oxytropis TaxID=3058913 RepID=UPI0034D6444C